MKSAATCFIGAVCVLMVVQCVTSQICPQCMCRSSYSPVCAKNTETGKLRGFSSKCVFECSTKCRKAQFEYLGEGRCGKYVTSARSNPTTTLRTTTKRTTTTAATTPTPTPIPYRSTTG